VNARDWTLAEIDRRIALARDSESGPWFDEDDLAEGLAAKFVADSAASDAALIVAHSPAVLLPLYEWMRGEVERHEERTQGDYVYCPRCAVLSLPPASCRFVAGLASALGYPGSGEGDGDEAMILRAAFAASSPQEGGGGAIAEARARLAEHLSCYYLPPQVEDACGVLLAASAGVQVDREALVAAVEDALRQHHWGPFMCSCGYDARAQGCWRPLHDAEVAVAALAPLLGSPGGTA